MRRPLSRPLGTPLALVLAISATATAAAARQAPPGTLHELVVAAPGGREVPTLVLVPEAYTTERAWPLILAMHGGPPGSVEGALRGAAGMVDVWAGPAARAGWIVAAPAMVDVVARDGRTAERLPYEIFHPEEARAVIDAVAERFRVDPRRIVSTGISLGSNFSIAFAAAHPDWFSAVVPVSTEGESREWLLRNLATVPTYVLQGAQDRNVRATAGPRAMAAIMRRLDHDIMYREFGDRGHEGFQEHYDDVLAWLSERPLPAGPPEVLRVPHAGIVPTARRVHWLEADTRQALVRARVVGPSEIEVTARWAGSVTLHLHEELVDLDSPLIVRVNGLAVPIDSAGDVPRESAPASASGDVARRAPNGLDTGRARSVTVRVPDDPSALARAVAFAQDLEPVHPEGTLSYWETYATRALEERFPDVGFEAEEAALPEAARTAPEQVALRVTMVRGDGPAASAGLREGDLLLTFGAEPFFTGRRGTEGLHHWLVRELREEPTAYVLSVVRDDVHISLLARYVLGPYRSLER